MNNLLEPVGDGLIIIRAPHQRKPYVNYFSSFDDALTDYGQSFLLQEYDNAEVLKEDIEDLCPDRLSEFEEWLKKRNVAPEEKVFLFDPTSGGDNGNIDNCEFLCESEFFGDEDLFDEYILTETAKDDMSWAKVYKADNEKQTMAELLFHIEMDIKEKHNAPSFVSVLAECGAEQKDYDIALSKIGQNIVKGIAVRVNEITPEEFLTDSNVIEDNAKRVFDLLDSEKKELADRTLTLFARENHQMNRFSYSAMKHFLSKSISEKGREPVHTLSSTVMR